jgi:hypothetical protein
MATSDPKAKADNSGDPANAEAAQAHANDSHTVFAKADPTTVDRDEDDGLYNAMAEVDRLRQQVIDAPAPGQDPDSRKRLGKTWAAAGEDVPNHLKVGDQYDTDSDRLRDAGIPDHDNAGNANPHSDTVTDPDGGSTTKADAAAKRSASGTRATSAPTGRSATPTSKASE